MEMNKDRLLQFLEFSLNDFIIIAIPFRQIVELLETKNWAELKEFSPKDAEMLENIIGRIKTKIK
jgi:hypothetical protein